MSTISEKLNQISLDKLAIKNAIEAKKGLALALPNDLSTYAPEIINLPSDGSTGYQRPSDWINLPILNEVAGEAGDKFVGLFHVQPEYVNEVALKFAGNATIDWGDGTVENVNSNVQVEHKYNFTTLPNTNLTDDGYKQVIITVTPQSGSRLTKVDTYLTLSSGRQNNSFLDISMSGDAFNSFSSSFRRQRNLQQFTFIGSNVATTASRMFYNCSALNDVPLFDLSSCTNTYQMLGNCSALNNVPLFDLSSCTTTYQMFYNCSALNDVPLFDLGSCTNTSYMFYNCSALNDVPLLDLSSCTNTSYMFISCYNLNSVPLFELSSCINTFRMFYGCYSLNSVPLFDLSNVTTTYQMFYGCYALNSVPLFDLSNVTTTYQMFYGCYALNDVTLDLSNSTNNLRMFENNIILISLTLTNIKSSLGLKNNKLDRVQLQGIIDNLVDVGTLQTLIITGSLGAGDLTSADILIATNKNWQIVL